ncbi:MAG TPA: hypothetical protein VG734_07940 [Lacunisphaera sp.]|nr:hypothetical protein [Lacunisphaera sp.]
MKIEALETLWHEQHPAGAFRPDPAELSRRLEPEFRRRGRFFVYEFFCLGLGLVVTPLLALVNYRYQPPLVPLLYWLHLTLFFVVASGLLASAIRRLRRHRALALGRTDTLAAAAAKAFASVETEMGDYRLVGRVAVLWCGVTLLSIYVNNPVSVYGWERFLRPVAVFLGLIAALGAIFWRHYAVNLRPEYARRKRLLEELGAGAK